MPIMYSTIFIKNTTGHKEWKRTKHSEISKKLKEKSAIGLIQHYYMVQIYQLFCNKHFLAAFSNVVTFQLEHKQNHDGNNE